MEDSLNRQKSISLVYDKQCPACDFYCRRIEVHDNAGEMEIIDARVDSEIRDQVTQLGWDIDQGMVVKIDGALYYGADAIHVLAQLSSRSGWFNRLNYWLFKSPRLAGRLYPLLRSCRNLLLKLLGRTKINNLKVPGNDRF